MRRSIGIPLALGIVLAILVLALAVGWQILVVGGPRKVTEGLGTLDWVLLVLGTVFFALVLAGLVWLSAWLIREMRLNQRQRAFLDAVTHEMKTPLASMRLCLDTLSLHDPAPPRRRQFLMGMREDLDRLDRTVEQVLAAARAEEPGRKRQPRGRVALCALLGDCIGEIRERHGLPEGAIRLDASDAAEVRGDASELTVVFRNLLENAVKYSGEPVDVRVRLSRGADGRVNVDIADRGIGIPPAELRKIFQRFYRAGRGVRSAAGLGLGLFIVRNLVRRQGGRVVARSDGAGEGSRFVVTLRGVPSPPSVAVQP